MAALNPGQFKGPLYHGTTFDLQGKDIKPARVVGKSVWKNHGHSGQNSSEHAFATEDEGTAWEFGSQAGTMKRAEKGSTKPGSPDRVRVHRVAPNPLMQRGVYHADHEKFNGSEDLREWRAPAFRVKETLDTMPGRQGTFPNLNWNQFRAKDSGYWSDMNHPTDDDIAEGHIPESGPSVLRGFARGSWAHDQAVSKKTGSPPDPVPLVDENQMDLFSGKTVEHHAENDDSALGDYHRNNLFGRV